MLKLLISLLGFILSFWVITPVRAEETCYVSYPSCDYCLSRYYDNSCHRYEIISCSPVGCNQATEPVQPTPIPHPSTECGNPGDLCDYTRGDGRSCQGLCTNSFQCRPGPGGEEVDYCYPTEPSPSPEQPNPSGTPTPSGYPGRNPIPTPNAKVIAPSLNNDYAFSAISTKALIPESVYATPTPRPGVPIPTTTPIKVGVEQSFLFDLIRALLCRIPLFGTFCPSELDLAGGKTKAFTDFSDVLSKSDRPSEINPPPATKDSNLDDNQSMGVTGNQNLNKIGTSLGDKTGFYGSDVPEDLLTDVNREVQRNRNQNLNLQNKPFVGDERVPYIDAWQEVNYKKYYPTGIQPLKQ